MDDAPRIGGLQFFSLIVGVSAAYVAVASHWWAAAVIAVAAFGLLIWLERYARRRARQDREAEEARFSRSAIAHLDFDAPADAPDPWDRP